MTAPYLTEEIAKRIQGRLVGSGTLPISGLKSLRAASSGDVALYLSAFGESFLEKTKADCVILDDASLALKYPLPSAIVVSKPFVAIEQISELFTMNQPQMAPDIADTAVIHKSVRQGIGISVGHRTSIDQNTLLGDDTIIGAGVTIGPGVTIGQGSVIGDNVMIAAGCVIESHVVIGEGCVIGARPYQYLKSQGVWQQGAICGAVILQSQVAVGANTVIERGVFSDTLIFTGVKIGPLVQIAHDVVIGSHTAVISHAAIGAGATIGEHCIIGGGCLIASQISVADDVVLTGGGTVSRTIAKQGIYSSAVNVKPHQKWRRNLARLHQLDSIVKRFRRLENRLKAKEKETT